MAPYQFNFKTLRALLLGAVCLIFFDMAWAVAPEPVHHLFVDQHGKLWAWGANDFGQLGRGDISAARLPLPVEIAEKIASAVTGRRHSVALDKAGSVWIWGDNSAGQLGTGDFRRQVQPVRLNLPPMSAVAAGAWHTLALDRSGLVWAWGSNTLGQLGGGRPGRFSVSATPRKIAGLDNVAAIYANESRALALRANGSVWAWGLQPGSTDAWLEPRLSKGAFPVGAVNAFDFGGRVKADGKPVNGAVVSVDNEVCARTDDHGVFHCLLPAGFAGVVEARKDGFDFAPAKISPVARKLVNQVVSGHAKAAKPRQEVALRQEASQQRAAPMPVNSVDDSEKVREKEAILPLIATPQAVPKAREDAPAQKKEDAPVQEREDALVQKKEDIPAQKKEDVPVQKKEDAIAQKNEAPPPETVRIAGMVRMGGGRPVNGVEINAVGAECDKTDIRGEYVCSVPYGWSGRLVAVKRNYKFSPRAVNYREVREDLQEQDLTAIYEPD